MTGIRPSGVDALDEHFKQALDAVPDPVFVIDRDRTLLHANPAACSLLGAEISGLVGTSCSSTLHGPGLDAICDSPRCLLEKVIASGHPERDIHQHVRRDGARFCAEICMSPVPGQGAPSMFLAMLRDVTATNRERHEVRQAGREFRSFVESAIEGVVAVDDSFRMTYSNPAFAQMLGMHQKDLIGRTMVSLVHPGDRDAYAARMATRRDGVSERYEMRFLKADGATMDALVSATAIVSSGSRFKGAFASIVDITDRNIREREGRERLSRLMEQRRAILEISRHEALRAGDTGSAFALITRICLSTLGVARAGVWLIDEGKRTLKCAALWDGVERRLTTGGVISPDDYPGYFTSLETARVIDARDARTDPRTAELAADYLEPLGIVSMLDTPIVTGGKLAGVLCIEHTGEPRRWHDDEMAFAGDAADQAAQVLVVAERMKAYAALRESEERYRSISEIISDFAVSFVPGPGGRPRHEWITDSFFRLSGYTEAKLRRQGGLPGLVLEEDAGVFSEFARTVFEQHQPGHGTFRINTRDKGIRHVSLQIRPVFDPETGRIVRFLGAGRDVTDSVRSEEERRRLDSRVQQTQKLESLGILAGGIAHDFNNLLVAILGNADLALDELSGVSPARPMVSEIVKASRRAADLCNQMLAYSGKGRLQTRLVDMSELVTEMAHMMEVSVSRKASIRYVCPPGLPHAYVDPVQIQQVLMNLIMNASDSLMDQPGTITVSTGAEDCDSGYLRGVQIDDDLPPGRYVVFEVADSGCGMDEETKARIFDPFFTTKFAGRGLGLAAVLGIIRGHRGAIKVYSEPGRGSTFKVLLPASSTGDPVSRPASENGLSWHGSGSILLVDDEETVLTVGSLMLERLGFHVVSANGGAKAVELFRAAPDSFRVVVLDLTMPGMDGEETYGEMAKLGGSARFVISSGYNEQEIAGRFQGRPVGAFLQKPYRLATLSECLRKLLS